MELIYLIFLIEANFKLALRCNLILRHKSPRLCQLVQEFSLQFVMSCRQRNNNVLLNYCTAKGSNIS